MESTQTHIDKINAWFQSHPKVLIALSGGVDSCLIAFMARKQLGKGNAIAVISNSASLKEKDLNDARFFARTYDIQLVEIDANEINDINYSSNPVNRCYYCKSNLYQSIHHLVKESYSGFAIINGNNYDDLGDYRPGMKAADEFEVLSPLLASEIDKNSIRQISKYYQLSVWNKPASPCLSSRFPYGEAITTNKLIMIEKAENLLNDQGFVNVRVRYRNGGASIEVPEDNIKKLKSILRSDLKHQLSQLGFNEAKIDEEGLVSGKLNRSINPNLKL